MHWVRCTRRRPPDPRYDDCLGSIMKTKEKEDCAICGLEEDLGFRRGYSCGW